MGQRLGSLQALTPRERYSRFIVASPSEPLSRHRERGWGDSWGPQRVARPDGERRAHRSGEGCPECNGGSARLKRRLRPTSACGYLWSVSVRSTDLDFSWEKNLNPYPALQATGVLGQSPKRVLVPFTRVKGTPRRRAVLTKFSKRLAPPLGDNRLLPNGSRCAGAGLIFA